MKARLVIEKNEPMGIYKWRVIVKSCDDGGERVYYYNTARFKVMAWLKYYFWRYIERNYRDRTVIKEIELKE